MSRAQNGIMPIGSSDKHTAIFRTSSKNNLAAILPLQRQVCSKNPLHPQPHILRKPTSKRHIRRYSTHPRTYTASNTTKRPRSEPAPPAATKGNKNGSIRQKRGKTSNHLRSDLFRDHDGSGVGVGADYVGHDGGVYDHQVVDGVHFALGGHDCHRIGSWAHLAGAG